MDKGLIPKISLIEASATDIPVLVGFLGELFKLEADFQPNSVQQTAAIKSILSNPGHAVIFKIDVGGEAAGMVALHFSISTAEGGWAGRIEDVYLKPEFRRRGIGKQVMKELITFGLNKGLKCLTLIADKDNKPALAFYKACGFKEMNLVNFIKKIN